MLLRDRTNELIEHEHFVFPDGQRHLKLSRLPEGSIRVTSRITTADALFDLQLLRSVLPHHPMSLKILYLMGGRMDRRIDSFQPYTLQAVANAINDLNFDNVTLFDMHSSVSLLALNRAANVLPHAQLGSVLNQRDRSTTAIAIPDKGAIDRVSQLVAGTIWQDGLIYCTKERDSQTGKLSNLDVTNPRAVKGKDVLIVDDICDGGGTFTGLSHLLRDNGARGVSLFVTHGVFSKGRVLPGIDYIFTTNSFWNWGAWKNFFVEDVYV